MKNIFSILILLSLVTTHASEVVRGVTLTDGQTLSAADLHSLVDTATIGSDFYSGKTAIGNLSSAYDFLVYDSGSGLFRRISANNAIYANTNLHLAPSVISSVPAYDRILVYNPTNNSISSVTLSNVLYWGSTNTSVSNLVFSTTNGFVLPAWNGAVTGFQPTNGMSLIVQGTNNTGASYITLTNFEKNVAADFGTNLFLPYTWRQLFTPWLVYGTNAVTNLWGVSTNFAITNLYLGANTNATLTDNDVLPLSAVNQTSNTTVTLQGVYQYLTNKNTLPNYTSARIQFSGYPLSLTITNDASAVNHLVHVATNVFTPGIPYAVSVITNASQIQIAEFQTNTLFYVVSQATNNTWCRVYSNYVHALSGANYLSVVNAGSGTANTLLYLTNYTSFNADVTQAVAGPTTIRDGVYDIWFRTNSADSLYYINGIVRRRSDTTSGWVSLDYDTTQSTNRFRVNTIYAYNVTGHNYPLVQLSVNPQ